MKVIGNSAGRRFVRILIFAGLLVLSIGSSPPVAETQFLSPEVKAVADGNAVFALNLFSKVSNADGNLVISPISLSAVFAMLYGGSRGATENQIGSVLQFPTNQSSLHEGMAGVLSRFTNVNSADLELKVNNGIWPQSGYQIVPAFMELCRGKYGANVDFVDFKASPQACCNRINAWAEQATKGNIRNLFTPGSISADTRLVLANAVYFKGKWASQFQKGKTRSRPFWLAAERPTQVPMMAQKSTFLYSSNEIAQIVELPYRGCELSMLVLLPQKRDDLAKLGTELTLRSFTEWTEKMYPADVELLLPKFKIDSRFSLGQSLSSMGIRDAFDGARANFTGITTHRPLFINSLEHGAIIEVDEEGTIAAAATGASFGCAQKPRSASFHADHPFLFIILDRPTRTFLFVGRVTNPGS